MIAVFLLMVLSPVMILSAPLFMGISAMLTRLNSPFLQAIF